jgi:class 3 adenylate cyclase/CHASE2 domain-containing sensor protein
MTTASEQAAAIPKARTLWLRTGVALAFLVVAVIVAPRFAPLSVVETWLRDVELALLAPVAPPHPRVVVIAIDEDTVAKFAKRSPLDRQFLANLIRTVAADEPAAIGIDVLIDQPTDAASDAALRTALHEVTTPVALAWAEDASAPGMIDPQQEAFLRQFVATVDNPKVQPALVNLQPSRDGIVRRLVLHADKGNIRDGIALALSRDAGGRTPDGLTMPLAYYGHPAPGTEPFNTIPAGSFSDLTSEAAALLKTAVQGRIVLIGASLEDTDRHRTPFAADPLSGVPAIPGVLIHAHAVAQLLDGREIATLPAWATALLLAIITVGGFQIGRIEREESSRALIVVGAVFALMIAAGLLVRFGGAGQVPSPGPMFPLATAAVGLLAATALGIAHERQRVAADRRLIHSVLTRYVPAAAIMDQLKNPETVALGGARHEMSFVFSDIAGFTTLCETAPPERLVPMLNRYLGGMTEIVAANGGTVGGFIGDAVVAFFGAPVPDDDHPTHALKAALAMEQFARKQREEARAAGLDFGRTRFGVNTGVASLGNFGGAGRLAYMAHGDVVNTTSRLEGANKFLGTDVAVSESTACRAKSVRLRPTADLAMKGKEQFIAVFEPAEEMDAAQYKAYMEAYDLMREGSPSALDVFAAFHARWPDDRLAELHLARLRRGETGCQIKLRDK